MRGGGVEFSLQSYCRHIQKHPGTLEKVTRDDWKMECVEYWIYFKWNRHRCTYVHLKKKYYTEFLHHLLKYEKHYLEVELSSEYSCCLSSKPLEDLSHWRSLHLAVELILQHSFCLNLWKRLILLIRAIYWEVTQFLTTSLEETCHITFFTFGILGSALGFIFLVVWLSVVIA